MTTIIRVMILFLVLILSGCGETSLNRVVSAIDPPLPDGAYNIQKDSHGVRFNVRGNRADVFGFYRKFLLEEGWHATCSPLGAVENFHQCPDVFAADIYDAIVYTPGSEGPESL